MNFSGVTPQLNDTETNGNCAADKACEYDQKAAADKYSQECKFNLLLLYTAYFRATSKQI